MTWILFTLVQVKAQVTPALPARTKKFPTMTETDSVNHSGESGPRAASERLTASWHGGAGETRWQTNLACALQEMKICRVLSCQKSQPGSRSKPRRCCPARQWKKQNCLSRRNNIWVLRLWLLTTAKGRRHIRPWIGPDFSNCGKGRRPDIVAFLPFKIWPEFHFVGPYGLT